MANHQGDQQGDSSLLFPPDSVEYPISEYGHYKVGDKVIHRKLLVRGVLKYMDVYDGVVHIWVKWDTSEIVINMHWDQIMKL